MAELMNGLSHAAGTGIEDVLMWPSHGGMESWRDTRYWYDCRKRLGYGHVVLQLTLEGAAFHEDDRGRRLVRPGQAFLNYIPGPFTYGYAAEVGGVYRQVYLALVGGQARQWCQHITQRFGNVLDLGLETPVHRLLMTLVRQPRTGRLRADRFIQSGQVYQLFMTLLSQLSQSRLSQTPHIGDAIATIQQQAADPDFNVQSLARQMGFSREHLTRQFQHVMGITPLDAITQQRLDLACSLLRQQEAKLDTIARACGFSSANYFCRIFRKRFGVSPGQYRQQPQMVLSPRLSLD